MIRRAGPADLPSVCALAAQLWGEHTPQSLEPEFASLLAGDEGAVFLFSQGDEDVGFAQVQLRHDYVEGAGTSPVGYLEGIYVRAEHRHKGIAGRLLAECERWAAEKGCTEFASDCETANAQSVEFHLKLGFTEVSRIVCFVKRLT